MNEPWAQDAVLLATLGAIVWYTFETKKLRLLMQQEREDARILTEPWFDFERKENLPHKAFWIITNRGGQVTRVNVQFTQKVPYKFHFPNFFDVSQQGWIYGSRRR